MNYESIDIWNHVEMIFKDDGVWEFAFNELERIAIVKNCGLTKRERMWLGR